MSDRKPMKPQRKGTAPPNPMKPAPKRFAQPKRPKRSGY